MTNIFFWFQLLKYEDLLLLSALCHCKLNIFRCMFTLKVKAALQTSRWALGTCNWDVLLLTVL